MPGGRPKKPEVIPEAFCVIADASLDRQSRIAGDLIVRLPDVSSQTIAMLAEASMNFMLNLGVQEHAPLTMRHKQGRRPEFALQHLLIDCATAHQQLTGEHPVDVLRGLSSGRDDGPESTGSLYHHPVIRYAGSILVVLGVEHDAGWRRQLSAALDRYLAQHPEV
jgi:hypothetical protein